MGIFDKEGPAVEGAKTLSHRSKINGENAKRPRWTKEEIKSLIQLWPDNTVEQLAQTLDRTPTAIMNIVKDIRKMGLKLPVKYGNYDRAPNLKSIIRVALDELGIKPEDAKE